METWEESRIRENNEQARDLIEAYNIEPLDLVSYGVMDQGEQIDFLLEMLEKNNIKIEMSDIFESCAYGETIEYVERYLNIERQPY